MPNGDFYIVQDVQTMNSQEVINTYVYEQVDGVVGAEQLAEAFLTDMISAIVNCQTTNVLHTEIRVQSVFSLSDFYVLNHTPPGIAGTVAGESLPTFVALAFFYQRATRAARNGHKRIAGVAESWQAGGIFTGPQATVDGLADAMAAPLQVVLVDTWEPRIWRRAKGAVLGDPGWPDSFHLVADVVFRGISSQNSRKVGRGS